MLLWNSAENENNDGHDTESCWCNFRTASVASAILPRCCIAHLMDHQMPYASLWATSQFLVYTVASVTKPLHTIPGVPTFVYINRVLTCLYSAARLDLVCCPCFWFPGALLLAIGQSDYTHTLIYFNHDSISLLLLSCNSLFDCLQQDCGLHYIPSLPCGLQQSAYSSWQQYLKHVSILPTCERGDEPGMTLSLVTVGITLLKLNLAQSLDCIDHTWLYLFCNTKHINYWKLLKVLWRIMFIWQKVLYDSFL